MNGSNGIIANSTTDGWYSSGNNIIIGGGATLGSITYQYNTPGGTGVELKSGSAGINPALIFRFLKSKLNKTETTKLKAQAKKLQKFVKDTKELGQQAAYEELAKMLTGVMGLLELSVCGFDQFISEETVKKFEYKVKDRTLRYDRLENFPRAIPDNIRKKIKQIQSKNLFNEYWILYLDYTKETLKTNKDKIREKDPILFGKLTSNPDKLFYLVDWVDEYCDLTLKKFVEEVKTKNPDFEMNTLPELDEKFLAELKEEVNTRNNRLKNTNAGNFRDHMVQEDNQNKKKRQKPWYKFWK